MNAFARCMVRRATNTNAKSALFLQDEETGDGTTSVIVLAGEVMAKASPFLENRIHPTIVIQVCCCESIENFLMCKYFSRFSVFPV